MPFDPENSKDVARLRSAMNWSEKKLRVFREQKLEALRQFVGTHYGENGAPEKVPINLIELGVSIFQTQLAPGDIKALVNSPYKELTPGAVDLSLALDYLMKQIGLTGALAECVTEALFGMAFMKVGVAVQGTPPGQDGYLHDAGQIFADPVLFEDMIFDMTAKRWSQVGFIGNRYRVPLEWAQENPQFNKAARERLGVSDKNSSSMERGGDESRSETLSQGDSIMHEDHRDHTELIEMYYPSERLVLTLASDNDGMPLNVIEWTGPEHGMYHRLSFEDVPGNLVSLPPVSMWRDLHDTTNRIFNKAVRQAERQKTVTGVQGHAKDDGTRLVDASDGEMIYMDNPAGVNEFSTGGAKQENLAMVIYAKEMLSYMGGNWDAIGGLAAQTQTVGQDRLLAQNASGRVKKMQDRVYAFTKGIATDIAFHLWEDPLIELPLTKPIPGTNIGIPITWNPDRRMGDFFQYNFEIDPYSMTNKSPEERANSIIQFVMQLVLPSLPMMAESGVAFDWSEFFSMVAKYTNIPELNRILTFASAQAERSPVGMEKPGMPASTTRNYVRENRPGPTRQGQAQVMMNSLMGGNPQESQMANLMRPAK